MESKPIEIKPLFKWGEIVYLKTDIEQLPRIVVGYILRPPNTTLYQLAQGTEETPHFAFELSDTADKELQAQFKESE